METLVRELCRYLKIRKVFSMVFGNFNDKNLLIISNSFPPEDDSFVGGIFVKGQVNELAKYFREVYVISPQPLGSNRRLKDYEYENIRVFFPHFFHLPIGYFRRKLGDNFFKAAVRVIRREGFDFDLIHAHYTWPSGVASLKLKEIFHVPLVITEHTSVTFQRYIKSRDPLIIYTWQNADALIRVRKGDINQIKELVAQRTNVYYVPNGFDKRKFYPISPTMARKKLNLPQNKKILLNVANMYSPVKGHKILLDAFSKVTKQRNDVLLVLVGDGRLRSQIEATIRNKGLRDKVILAGAKSHDEIPLWMNAADLFVLPSLSEGNPTVMFEALGVGLPFVGTAVGGVPEIITSEDYGLLCKPGDPQDLAEKILIALDKEWNREKIIKYAEQFTWGNIARQILKIYYEVLKG